MRIFVFATVLTLLAGALPAQSGEWEFRFGPRIIGATIDGRYITEPASEQDVETSVTARLSGAYESVGYNRAADGSLLFVDQLATDAVTSYDRFDLLWELGLQQGIVPRADSASDAAVVYAIYRGRYRLPLAISDSEAADAGLPPITATLRGSVLTGLAWSTVVKAPLTRELSGVTAELAVEWGPSFLHNEVLGSAEFTRLTVKGSAFLPLLALPPRDGFNRFSLYLAGFSAIDWAYGPDVPIAVRQTTGGRSLRGAPGGSVRGYGSGRFDSTFKAITNLELRASLPSIILPSIIPGLVVFTDAGYFNDLDSASPVESQDSGLLLSSGAGLSIDFFDLAALVFYTSFAWTGDTRSGEIWNPLGIGFGFHF